MIGLQPALENPMTPTPANFDPATVPDLLRAIDFGDMGAGAFTSGGSCGTTDPVVDNGSPNILASQTPGRKALLDITGAAYLHLTTALTGLTDCIVVEFSFQISNTGADTIFRSGAGVAYVRDDETGGQDYRMGSHPNSSTAGSTKSSMKATISARSGLSPAPARRSFANPMSRRLADEHLA
jgi:hypothetical protein